jgi:hypothetical protein
MHAYRDAIRRSAGAYVLYPGTEVETNTRQQFEEIVPGIGAFPFRVGPDGNADDSSVGAVRSFLDEVFEHAANQASSYERSRYWADRSYEEAPATLTARNFLVHPPADTLVLLGFVRSSDHLSWVLEKQLYNLRADARSGSVGHDPALLGAEVVVLYGQCLEVGLAFRRVGVPELLTRDEIAELGYPDPRGSLYCCLQLQTIDLSAEPIPSDRVGLVHLRLRPAAVRGEPIVVSWAELVGETTP